MSNTRPTFAKFALAGGLLVVQPAFASFHLWRFSEAFSNADGSIQFIELWTTVSGENHLEGIQIVSTSPSGTQTFTFPSDVPPNTANKRLLLATPGFAALKNAPTPDFTIPAPFFDPGSATISLNYGPGFDLWTLPNGLPTDCVSSRHRSLGGDVSIGTNSPQNFVGETGSVNCENTCPADINGSGAVDVDDLLVLLSGWGPNPGHPADLNNSGAVDVDDLLTLLAAWGACP